MCGDRLDRGARPRPPAVGPVGLTNHSAAEHDRRRALATLAVIIAVGAALRLARLGSQSFWLDEAFSVILARAPWQSFVYQLRTAEANSGFYYLLLRSWERLGANEAHVRLLSALAGIATIPLTAAVAERLFGRAVALTAAAVIALDPFDIWASQEARGYALVILLVTCSTWAFVRAVGGDADPIVGEPVAIDSPPRRRGLWWALYVVASALAVYTHLYASFVVLAQWLSLAVRLRSIGWRGLVTSGVALAVLLAPMALFVLGGPHGNIDWLRGAFGPHLSDVWATIRRALGVGGAVAACGYVAVCGALLWVGVRMTRRATEPQTRWAYLVPVLWFVTPIAIPLAVSLTLKPVFDPRYVTISAPAVAILAAAVTGQSRSAWRIRLLAVVVAAELFGDWAYFAGFHKEDWREATRSVLADSRAGDVAIFYAPYVRRPFDYYAAHATASPPSGSRSPQLIYPSSRYSDFTLDSVVPLSLGGAVDAARAAPRAWLILSHTIRADSACVEALDAALRPALRQLDDRRLAGGIELRLYAHAGSDADSGRAAPAVASTIARACPQA